jgi:hypothetical protein
LPLLLLVPAFGFECEYFDPVVVPAVDSYPPVLATRAWINGEEYLHLGPVEEYVDGAGDIVIAPGMWDSGGAEILTVEQTLWIYCHDDDVDPELGQQTEIWFYPLQASQSGGVGSTVSNGLFVVGNVTDLSGYDWYCYEGFELEEVVYEWSIVGRDFAGNQAEMDGGMIIYHP